MATHGLPCVDRRSWRNRDATSLPVTVFPFPPRDQFHLLLLAPASLLILSLIAWPILITVELSLHDIRLFDILRGGLET